jgi:hypothetical protein
MDDLIKEVYEGTYVKAAIMTNQHKEEVLVIAAKNDTLETDEGNVEWDTVIALYAKDGVEPQRFEFTPSANGYALFKMLAK